MKRTLLHILLLFIMQGLCLSGMAQASYTLKSSSYIACPGAKVLLELNEVTGQTYAWYTAQTGGILLGSVSTLTYTKSSTGTDIVWLQINSEARVPVSIYQSNDCGSALATACPTGTVLFKEDFGGNNTTDAFVKTVGISQVTGYTYNNVLPESGAYTIPVNNYFIRKQGTPRLEYIMDDHTYSGDITKGYLLQVYANSDPNVIYKTQLDNLCSGTNISFSSWLASTKNCAPLCVDSNNVVFVLEKTDGTVLAKYFMKNLPNANPEWQQYGFDYIIPAGISSIVFKIVNNKTSTVSTSFVVDDIEIRFCTPQVTTSISPKSSVCQGENVIMNGSFTNNGYFTEPLVYKWVKSTSGSLLDQSTWTTVGTNQTLTLNAVTVADQGYYRLVVGNASNIDIINCRVMSDPVYLEVKTGCTASLVLATNDSIVTTKNNLVLINPLANDQYTSCEKEGVKLSVLKTTVKAKTAIFNTDKLLVYTPAQDFIGRDSVQYEIECNGKKDTAWCIIFVVQEALVNSTTINSEYVACPTAQVVLEVNAHSGETYTWYNQQTGGTLLGTGSSLTFTKTTAPVDFVWLQINSAARIPVYITLSEQCGNTVSTTCDNGVVLFKEDFGGNSVSDPLYKSSGISQVIGYNYIYNTSTIHSYAIRKSSPNRDVWYMMDDHTYTSDLTRGYMLVVDANEAAGQFYEYQIDNLCAGIHFSFSAWISSLEIDSWPNKTNTVFLLEKLDGTPIIKYYTGNIPDKNPIWKQYGFDFTVPDGVTSLKLRIINNGDGSSGNDFVMDDIEIRLCVPPVEATISPKDTVCEGDSVTLSAKFTNDGSFTEPLFYKWFKSANGTDNWTDAATGQNLIYNPVKQSNQGYYKVAVTSSGGDVDLTTCRSISNPVYLKVNACVSKVDSFCKDGSYSFGGKLLTSAGVYKDTLTSILGNDSIVTLKLTEISLITKAITDSFCIGGTYDFNGKTLTIPGSYKDTLTTVLGCDSIVTLTLIHKQAITFTQNQQICQGISYTFGGTPYSSSGTYTHTFTTATSCDSVVTLNLTVIPLITKAITDSFCIGGTYDFNGKTLTIPGSYKDTLITALGCDSIVTLTLTNKQSITKTLEEQTCQGIPYFFAGINRNTTGIYKDTVKTTLGCDSVITLNLTVNPIKTTTLTDSFCIGGTYDFNGKTLTTPSVYKDTFTTTLGCDSIITLTLTHKQAITSTQNQQICQGTVYTFGGISYNNSGTYIHTFTTATSCDSVVALNLTVTPPIKKAITDSFCIGNSYSFNGEILTASGIYTDSLHTLLGCDSIITLVLNTNFLEIKSLNVVINQGESYKFGGEILTASGVYSDTLQNMAGCDSILVLNLFVKEEHSADPDSETTIVIPEVFSPNGDDVNDYFEIKGIESYPKNHILILNRWGNKVYEGKPYTNQWDGRNYFGVTVGDNLLPVGTYFYIFDLGNGSAVRKGFIYLNR